jgi:hypothetical protein
MVTIVANRIAASSVQGRRNRAEAQRSGLPASIPALPSSDTTIAGIDSRSKSP